MAAAIETRAINTIRCLSADIVEKANSGHPGAPMGCAPIAHTLFSKVMRYNPANPKWASRDRFILSNGHGCALLYSMLHLTGYANMPMEELKKFRKLGAITAGHPENTLHAAIEVSTGPLGQGLSNGVGMALAQAKLAAEFNRDGLDIMDSFIYVLCGDGCLQEGVTSEASSLAGHLQLGRLIVLYDDNKITIDGETSLSFTEDVAKRYEAYGWHVQVVADGDNDPDSIHKAILAAKAVTDRPSLIKVATTIGFGSEKQGKEECHGAPLGAADLKHTKTKLGFSPDESFVVPAEVAEFYRAAAATAAASEATWAATFAKYASAHPALAAEFTRRMAGELPPMAAWFDKLPRYTPADKADATRNFSGVVLNALAASIPEIIGGSADLTPSNKTQFKGAVDFQAATPAGRYIRFGVREHAMAAICNGITAFGGLIPYCGTFLNFVGYAQGAVRLSALSHFRVVYVGTHDSIGLGEDGPTHQPVEMLESLRTTPNMFVYRPADGNEVSAAYALAILTKDAPAVIALSRQNVPNLPGSSIEKAMKGGYVVYDSSDAAGSAAAAGKPDLLIVSTGTEVPIAIDGAKALAAATGKRIAVSSLMCMEVFAKQSREYQLSVIPDGMPVLSIEASHVHGWEKYAHASIGMTYFGLSAPGSDVYKALGITADAVKTKGAAMIAHFEGKAVPPVFLNMPTF